MTVRIPIRLPSLANERQHWAAKNAMRNRQQAEVRLALLKACELCPRPQAPCVVTLTRVARRRLDDDNLAAAFKFVRDAVAAFVGTDDGSPLYTWRYEQRAGPYGVEITITEGDDR